jgi:tetratricopeptide (TPR) repeat protein
MHNKILSYQLAQDICSKHLKIPFANIENILLQDLPDRKFYLNNIDYWVDRESIGDYTVLKAQKLAQIIAQKLKEQPLCCTYNKNLLSRDNKIFINFLQNYCDFEIKYTQQQQHTFIYHAPKILLPYTWQLAAEGADELAMDILKQNIFLANSDYIATLYLTQLQYLCVATQNYHIPLEIDITKKLQFFDNSAKKQYYLSRAWCAIMMRDVDLAGQYFTLANLNPNSPPNNLNDLYNLNIYALYLHLSHQTKAAFAIEHKIKDNIDTTADPSTQIYYINSMNLARLYRHDKQYSMAFKFYQDAFTTIRGTIAHNDLIYSNICYGILHTKNQNYTAAVAHWVQAALYWTIWDYKLALNWRAARALLGPHYMPHAEINIIDIENIFCQKINELLRDLNINLNKINTPSNIRFLATKNKNPNIQLEDTLYMPAEFAVYINITDNFLSPENHALSQLLGKYLLFKTKKNITATHLTCFIDDYPGIIMPKNDIELTKRKTQLQVEAHKTIHKKFVVIPQIPCTRYKRNIKLNKIEQNIINKIQKHNTYKYYLDFNSIEQKYIQQMEQQGIVAITLCH